MSSAILDAARTAPRTRATCRAALETLDSLNEAWHDLLHEIRHGAYPPAARGDLLAAARHLNTAMHAIAPTTVRKAR